jgi:hypothetical protein
MEKNWLRGLLLGVSLALLVGGGVTLAQGLYVAVDQACFECWPGSAELVPGDDEYIVHLDYGGWSPDVDDICEGVHSPGPDPMFNHSNCGPPDTTTDPCYTEFWVSCEGGWDGYDSCFNLPDAEEIGAAQLEEAYGQWVGWVEEWDGEALVGSAEVTFIFAEDCEALREEFVPEPGSIILLGSGLAGLAGYATLRWRTRE